MTNELKTVLALYQRELDELDRVYHERRSHLRLIIDDLRARITRPEAKNVIGALSGDDAAGDLNTYSEMKLIDAAAAYLGSVGRPADSREIATALLEGGYETKGDRSNFHKSVYNQLKSESDRTSARIKQMGGDDKRFRIATEADQLPEPGPGSQPGIAFPNAEPGSAPPAFVPSGFGGSPSDG